MHNKIKMPNKKKAGPRGERGGGGGGAGWHPKTGAERSCTDSAINFLFADGAVPSATLRVSASIPL
jgi:prepilin-type processing-associated H-X9-DG protein